MLIYVGNEYAKKVLVVTFMSYYLYGKLSTVVVV